MNRRAGNGAAAGTSLIYREAAGRSAQREIWCSAGIENDVEYRMEFHLVRRRSRLPVGKIEHAHTRNLHRDVCGLEARCRRQHGVEFGARAGDGRQKRAGRAHARRRRNLRNHGVAGCILDDQVIVGIALQFVERQGRVDHPDGRLLRRNAIVGRNGAGRGKRDHIGNRGVCGRTQVHQTSIGIGSSLNRPTLHSALRPDRGGGKGKENTSENGKQQAAEMQHRGARSIPLFVLLTEKLYAGANLSCINAR